MGFGHKLNIFFMKKISFILILIKIIRRVIVGLKLIPAELGVGRQFGKFPNPPGRELGGVS